MCSSKDKCCILPTIYIILGKLLEALTRGIFLYGFHQNETNPYCNWNLPLWNVSCFFAPQCFYTSIVKLHPDIFPFCWSFCNIWFKNVHVHHITNMHTNDRWRKSFYVNAKRISRMHYIRNIARIPHIIYYCKRAPRVPKVSCAATMYLGVRMCSNVIGGIEAEALRNV